MLDWIKCIDLNIKYSRETEKTTKILSVYPLFINKFMFIQIPLIYANIYKITDEWNLQVTKHLLFKQIQLKEGFFKKLCLFIFIWTTIPIQKILNATLQFPWGHIFTLKNMKPKKDNIMIVNMIIIDRNFVLYCSHLFVFSRFVFYTF